MRTTLEFGISLTYLLYGRRKTYSTNNIIKLINRKKSSFIKHKKLKNNFFEKNTNNICENLFNPHFLYECYNRLKKPLKFNNKKLDKKIKKWIYNISQEFKKNISFKFSYKKKIFTQHIKKIKNHNTSLKDKIIFKAIEVVLKNLFKKELVSKTDYYSSKKKISKTLINKIKLNFKNLTWFYENSLNYNYNFKLIIVYIKKKVKDKFFIYILHKYFRLNYYYNTFNKTNNNKNDTLHILLCNIYFILFDKLFKNKLIKKFNKKKTDILNLKKYKKLKYIRYNNNFLLGINGTYADCENIHFNIKKISQNCNLTLKIYNFKIIHSEKKALLFSDYQLLKKKRLIKHILQTKLFVNTPLKKITEKFKEKGFLKKNKPTKCGKLVHLPIYMIINYYLNVQRKMFDIYFFTSNFYKVSNQINYILKYSCSLTITSKMNLKTLRKTFKIYGQYLNQRFCIKNYPH